jgi:hypothetical protein
MLSLLKPKLYLPMRQESPAAGPAPAPFPVPAVAAGVIRPRLIVQRGPKRSLEYPILRGANYIGRGDDDTPAEIDLTGLEPQDRIWSSARHAVIRFEIDGGLTIEDLNSSNGTFLNRARIWPGRPQPLKVNDLIQIGEAVHLKLAAEPAGKGTDAARGAGVP